MKKIALLVLLAVLCLALSGCARLQEALPRLGISIVTTEKPTAAPTVKPAEPSGQAEIQFPIAP